MFKDSIVLYGCSSGGVDVLEQLRKNGVDDLVKLVVDRCPENARPEFDSYMVEKPEILKEINYDFELVIGSMYFKQIYDDLGKKGLLENHFLKNIWVYNYYSIKPPYDEKTIYIKDDEYQEISNVLCDKYSKDLLNRIVAERKAQQVGDKNHIFKNIIDEMMWEGDEDYWKRVKGSQVWEKNIVLDAGVYRGEKIIDICNAIGSIDTYYGFEPVQENYAYIEGTSYDGIKNFVAKKCAIGATTCKIKINVEGDASSINHKINEVDNYEEIEMITIDSLELHEEANYFLKMDIEGSELEALKGGQEFIKNLKPNLAICVYHKTRDIIDIPKYLLSIRSDYKFYLAGGNHTILIAK